MSQKVDTTARKVASRKTDLLRPLNADENAWALDLIGRYREWKSEKAEYCP
jgi:hypothetical protein